MRSTPKEALEVILNVPPIHLEIVAEAVMENYRCEISDMKEIRQLTDSTYQSLESKKKFLKSN